jgi:hypothetical protein
MTAPANQQRQPRIYTNAMGQRFLILARRRSQYAAIRKARELCAEYTGGHGAWLVIRPLNLRAAAKAQPRTDGRCMRCAGSGRTAVGLCGFCGGSGKAADGLSAGAGAGAGQ